MYLVPSSFAPKAAGIPRLLRSSTSTSLAYAQKMQRLNGAGKITGYFNESWSESEICKCTLDPKKLIKDEMYTYLTPEKENVTFTVRLEITTHLLLYKTPAPSPISDKERRTLILSQDRPRQKKLIIERPDTTFLIFEENICGRAKLVSPWTRFRKM